MPCNCCISSCKNNVLETTGVSYHLFPTQSEKRQRWIDAVMSLDPTIDPNKLSKSACVCSAHFLDCDFMSSVLFKKRTLKKTAVPSRLIDSFGHQNDRLQSIQATSSNIIVHNYSSDNNPSTPANIPFSISTFVDLDDLPNSQPSESPSHSNPQPRSAKVIVLSESCNCQKKVNKLQN